MEASQSHLFTIRIWAERGDTPDKSWRGQVEHVLSGERQYFRDWAALVKFLQLSAQLGGRLAPETTESGASDP